MLTDIFLHQPDTDRRLVVETKFTDAFTEILYRTAIIKPQYMYQLNAYLMSQTGAGIHADRAEGVLLFVRPTGEKQSMTVSTSKDIAFDSYPWTSPSLRRTS
jgi:5-methylcytosine-specific restriction enzyme subunit McrC